MADLIQLLPDAIINQIAAGEVVQRPASVVKELMENSIDAGAMGIKVIIKDAGKSLIQVIDNGSGMSVTDARMAFERHATSKIRQTEDLSYIRTMGFRGEAMASIAAVAQVELKTRRHADELGNKLVVEGSELKSTDPCQCVVGTNTMVKNLFYNVPVRRNFLKTNNVEMRHIIDEFLRIAIANPDVFFSLHHNNLEQYHLTGGNLRQRLVGIFGAASNGKLVPVGEETDILKISGFIGKPDFSKKSRGDQYIFVNDRFIKSSYLNHSILSAYDNLLPKDYFPFYCIFIDIDPQHIDVNVHPTKQEIKFEDEKLVYNYMKVSIRHALGQNSITPSLDFERDSAFAFEAGQPSSKAPTGFPESMEKDQSHIANEFTSERDENNLENWEKIYQGLFGDEGPVVNPSGAGSEFMGEQSSENHELDFGFDANDPMSLTSVFSESENSEEDQDQEPITLSSASNDDAPAKDENQSKKLFQLHSRYIGCQTKSGFMLIDQQAASERIMFERYLDLLEEQELSIQKKLFTTTIELNQGDAEVLKSILHEINLLGFEISDLGNNAFVIHGIPADMDAAVNEEDLVHGLIDQFKENQDLSVEYRENIAISMAYSSSIKKGKRLSIEEMKGLVDQLFACSMPFKSPRGNTCVISFDMDEIAALFESGKIPM
ncbi:MAG: DNA mismatch repair endonuclease MutL [Saprospiraceae bacterium]|nr:DNA mismatch repair endonuclease MutL [Saprospiraceae bacterium]